MAALHAASLAVPATEATRVATLSPAAAAPEEERPALPVPAARTDAAGERTATARKEGEKENVATSFWERSRTFELRPNATQAAQAAQLAAETWAAHAMAAEKAAAEKAAFEQDLKGAAAARAAARAAVFEKMAAEMAAAAEKKAAEKAAYEAARKAARGAAAQKKKTVERKAAKQAAHEAARDAAAEKKAARKTKAHRSIEAERKAARRTAMSADEVGLRRGLRRELGPNLSLQLMEVSLQLEAESAHVPDDDFGVFLEPLDLTFLDGNE